MNLRFVLLVLGAFVAAVALLFIGGFAEIELLADSGSGYLPEQPTVLADHAPVERWYGSR